MKALLDAWTRDPLGTAVSLLVSGCVVAVLVSVLLNFLSAQRGVQKQEEKSIVVTSTMMTFFLVYYGVLRLGVGVVPVAPALEMVLLISGVGLIVLGTVVNIWGRASLGRNWADKVTLYENQTLVTGGAFAVVRHPLYASLIWMFVGGAFFLHNGLALLLTLGVFLPFMTYRARQEERLLSGRYADFARYRNEVGMLFPKVRR